MLQFVPTDSTHYDLFDETVPLYQIAVHGLVSYSGIHYNLLNDGQRTFLHQVEYGATPSFVLTKNSSAQLYRTEANNLYSTQYDFWRDELIRQYEAMAELASVAEQFIIDHRRLSQNVYQTTYEDGTRVIVNYGEQPYTMDSAILPSTEFAVLRGEN